MKHIENLFELQELEMGSRMGAPDAASRAAALRKEIPPTILGHYARLTARGKKGVATVQHFVCSGCRMQLSSGAHAKLLRDDDIVMCDSCARYLLLIPSDPPVTVILEPPPKSTSPKRGRPKGSKSKRAATESPISNTATHAAQVPVLAVA